VSSRRKGAELAIEAWRNRAGVGNNKGSVLPIDISGLPSSDEFVRTVKTELSPFSFVGHTSFPGNGVTMADGWIATSNALSPYWMFFGYDPLGRCVKRWIGGLMPEGNVPPPASNPATYLYYDGWNLIQEGSSSTDAQRQYVHGARVDEIAAQITPGNGTERYFHYDASGNCILQTYSGGGIAEQYEYDAFGYPYFFDANGYNIGYSRWGNRFLFTGREWLSDLKLYDYRNRLYQPELGRFMQPDPKEFGAGDYNLYRYCRNDPVNRTDPTGLIPDGPITPEESKGMLIGTAAAASVVAVPIAVEEGGAALLTLAARVPFVARLLGPAIVATNRLNHIFGDPSHNLGGFVKAQGSERAAFAAVQKAANSALAAGKLTPNAQGILPSGNAGNIIKVGDTAVRLIGGRVIDGKVQISSFSRKGLE